MDVDMIKAFKTYDEQIEILKGRGLVINDVEEVKKILMTENYYNVINGYKDLFVYYDNDLGERFEEGCNFHEVYALYEFDRALRDIFMSYILRIENTLRSLISYHFSKEHGKDNYMTFNNFETLKGVTNNRNTLQDRAKRIQSLISNVQKEIGQSIEKKEYIKHYIIDYGFVPLWVLVNTISLGTLSQIYNLMKQKEQYEVAKYWNIKESELLEYIRLLAFYRNLCAHDDRIYNSKSYRKCTIPNNVYHELMEIPMNNNQYVCGKEDVFALVITIKTLLPHKEYITFFNKLNGSIIRLSKKINCIKLDDVLKQMGFPKNWHDIKYPYI